MTSCQVEPQGHIQTILGQTTSLIPGKRKENNEISEKSQTTWYTDHISNTKQSCLTEDNLPFSVTNYDSSNILRMEQSGCLFADEIFQELSNKANLRDLIAATGLVILLKLDTNRRFFSPCGLEIWWMTWKNYRAPLLHYIKLCASSQTPRIISNWSYCPERSIRVKIGDSLSCVTLKFDGWPWKTIGHLFYVASSLMHHFIIICEFKLELQSGNG